MRSTITRLRYTSTSDFNGYRVRVSVAGYKLQAYFGPGAYGTFKRALEEATRYREEIRDLVGWVPDQFPLRRLEKKGVAVYIPGAVREDAGSGSFSASWTDEEGVRRSRKFSCAKFGRSLAERYAWEALKDATGDRSIPVREVRSAVDAALALDPHAFRPSREKWTRKGAV